MTGPDGPAGPQTSVDSPATASAPALPVVPPSSSDLAPAGSEPGLPGVHRGGFARLPTAPIGIAAPVVQPDTDSATLPAAQWILPAEPAPQRGLAAWALVFSIAGLAFSLFVGWAFPIGLVGVVTAILAMRRPLESRAVATWALLLGIVSVLYSAGWLLWAASRADLLG